MGMDPIEVEDFLDEKGLIELNPELVIDHMKNPRYVNPLKRVSEPRQAPPKFDYYYPSTNNNKRADPKTTGSMMTYKKSVTASYKPT